jgi:5-methylcytosine-specific restriction endonuclease McrA
MILHLPSGEQVQVCTKCSEAKSLGDFYVKDKRTGRLFTWCKACHIAISGANFKRKYEADPEPFKVAAKAYREANLEAVKERQKERRDTDRVAIRARERLAEATPKYKAKKAEYRKAKDAERKAYNAAYRKANAERIKASDDAYRAAHPELYREAARRWERKNPLQAKVIKARGHARRRAILEGSELGSYTAAEWEAIKDRCGRKCLRCGRHESERPLTVDHVIPLCKGGRNESSNLQPLCGPCNSTKREKTIDYRPESMIVATPERSRKPRQAGLS